VCGGGVCVGGGGRAFYYTYIHSEKRLSYEGAELLSVLVAETIHLACTCEGGGRGGEGGARTFFYAVRKDSPARELSCSACWLQKLSVLRVCFREEDAGGRDMKMPLENGRSDVGNYSTRGTYRGHIGPISGSIHMALLSSPLPRSRVCYSIRSTSITSLNGTQATKRQMA
jgi:hypothetical protein